MFLKRIELQGFKSFAEKTVLQFDHDVTGIVGPNGCGKSNVNDAIRWVLGEQSYKSLRSGTGMTDIIFSGSEEKRPVNMARVTLVFDNTRRIFDIAFDEVEITRTLERSGDGRFYINKTPCRLKDIQELVMDTGLGKDSLSIITQGNISSFADARPEERRALFEEAAGVARYKKRKKVSLQKLENTQENLDRLQDIVDEIEKQMKPLEKQAEKAQKYLALREELAKVEVSVLVDQIRDCEEKKAQITKQLEEIALEEAAGTSQMLNLDQQSEALHKRMYELDAAIASLQQVYTEKVQENARLEVEKAALDEKRKYAIEMADASEKAAQLLPLVREAKQEMDDRAARLHKAEAETGFKEKEVQRSRAKEPEIDSALRQARSQQSYAQSQYQSAQNALQQPYLHQQGVKAVMQARKSLPGLEGVVSELLEPKENMAQAISSALGGAVYQVVTRDEAAAREAIGFLKRNRSGRATFLPMSVCSPRYASAQQDAIARGCPGAVGWASELVENDPRYDRVRDRLLGNIFVCESLENANECARRLQHKVKIVTLDGDIVHAGGSMTGGYNRPQSSPVTLREKAASLKKELEQASQRVQKLEEQLRKAQEKTRQLQDECTAAKVEQTRLQSIYEVKKGKFEQLQAQYQEYAGSESQLEETSEDDNSLSTRISRMHEEIDEADKNLQAARAQRLSASQEAEQADVSLRRLRRESQERLSQRHKLELQFERIRGSEEQALNQLNSEYAMTYEFARTKAVELDMAQAREEVAQLRSRLKGLGNVNLDAPEEYRQLKERYEFLGVQMKDLQEASQSIRESISEMDKTMSEQFSTMFHKINGELQGVFTSIFGGGKARLILTDPEDMLGTGVDIDVQPPGKLVKNITSFSGGEKALIAISVLFAILKARTVPLCIFDEAEAALDQANVERFARYLGNFREESQFLVVTHRPGTMEQCDTLYGVTMQKNGISQVLKVQLEEAAEYVQPASPSSRVSV